MTLDQQAPPRSEALKRLRNLGVTQGELIDAYHLLEYELGLTHQLTVGNTNWLGYKLIKLPNDMFLYAELLWELMPAIVVETGTLQGGSALFYATVMDAYGWGKVITIDLIDHNRNLPVHPRINYVRGRSSTDPNVVAEIKRQIELWTMRASGQMQNHGHVLVSLDSDHSRDHVFAELEAYADMVTAGSWLIVEDTNLDGRPIKQVKNGPGMIDDPGPWTAVERWLPTRPDFRLDEKRGQRYLHSMHSWLRRIRS